MEPSTMGLSIVARIVHYRTAYLEFATARDQDRPPPAMVLGQGFLCKTPCYQNAVGKDSL
jgi:hypothetical protein